MQRPWKKIIPKYKGFFVFKFYGGVSKLKFSCLSLKNPSLERQVLNERKNSFIEKASNPAEKVDSCPKEPTPYR